MAEPRSILVLGGTTEAAALAKRLAADPRVAVTSSLAGRTRRPAPLPGGLRVGGFGGVEGLAGYLEQARTGLVIDATHPFAARISAHAAEACARLGLPRLKLLRPSWARQSGDRWQPAADLEAAARLVAENRPPCAFLSIGRQELAAFSALAGVHLVVRMIDPPEDPPPLADCEVVIGRGPFREADEAALFARHGIALLVAKNSGGAATYAKIAAARGLDLPVVMVERPPPPAGPRAESVEQALDWIEGHLPGGEAAA